MNTTHFNDEGLILLQAAILEQAIHDYKIELKCGGGHRLEKWFLSEWGQMLSRWHGEEIIERCKREVNYEYLINIQYDRTIRREALLNAEIIKQPALTGNGQKGGWGLWKLGQLRLEKPTTLL